MYHYHDDDLLLLLTNLFFRRLLEVRPGPQRHPKQNLSGLLNSGGSRGGAGATAPDRIVAPFAPPHFSIMLSLIVEFIEFSYVYA